MDLVQISQMQGRIPVTIFHIQDRINLGNYKVIEQAAKEAYDNGTRDLIVDLSKSESLTSIGIRALVIIHKMLSADNGKHLKLAGAIPPSVKCCRSRALRSSLISTTLSKTPSLRSNIG